MLGLLDDRFGLSWKLRLGVETAVALTLVVLGWRMSLFIDAPWLTGALSVVWIVGLINSFNMLDNMDGLSAGVAAIAAAILAVVMLTVRNPATNQPQLFIGRFVVGDRRLALGVPRAQPPAGPALHGRRRQLPDRLSAGHDDAHGHVRLGQLPKHAILAPLCVLAVPLYDTLTVVVIRLRSGRSPFVGDRSHFSHRLVELGMTKGQAVLTIYLATATCGLGALLLHEVDALGAVVILALVACTLVLVAILETAGRRRRSEKNQGDMDGTAKREVSRDHLARDRWRPWLLGTMAALWVASPLGASESAALGDGLPVVMLWIALAVVWLLGSDCQAVLGAAVRLDGCGRRAAGRAVRARPVFGPSFTAVRGRRSICSGSGSVSAWPFHGPAVDGRSARKPGPCWP